MSKLKAFHIVVEDEDDHGTKYANTKEVKKIV